MRTIENAIAHMMNPSSDRPTSIKEAVLDVVLWEKEMEINPCPSGGGLGFAMNEMEDYAKADPVGTWELMRNGTNAEFAVLVNCISELGKDFSSDSSLREIMRLAKSRKNEEVMEQTRAGFGVLFEQYWNETETGDTQPVIPTVKSHTFGQVYKGA